MKITYDPKYNISYIKFRDSIEEVETINPSLPLFDKNHPKTVILSI